MTATMTSVDSLVEFLGEVRVGAVPVTFTARTKVHLNKKHRTTKEPCPFAEVWKVARVNAMLQCNYGSAMERRTGEDYVPGETWHEPVKDSRGRLTPCSRDPKTDKFYLRVQDPTTLESRYVVHGLSALHETVVEYEALKPYLPKTPIHKEGDKVRLKKVVYAVSCVCPDETLILMNDDGNEVIGVKVSSVHPVVGFKVYGLENIESVTIDEASWSKPAFTFEGE